MNDRPFTPNPPDSGLPRLSLRLKDAAPAIGISERKLWEITNDQTSGIPHLHLGKCVVYPVRELMDWLAERAKRGGDR